MIMQTRRLGKTNLFVTELGFGGASIGNLYRKVSNSEAEATIKTAWENNICYFDTAAQYGHGLSEVRLGHALYEYPREDFIVSTKVGKRLKSSVKKVAGDEPWFIDHLPFSVEYDYSYDGIMRCAEDSMQRMSLNTIDIMHMHDLDNIVLGETFDKHFRDAMDSGLKALDELKNNGFIKAISLGIKESQVCNAALKYGDFDCFMLQGNFTLLDQSAKQNGFLDQCYERGISILQAGPFGSGILAKGSKTGARYDHVDAPESILDKVRVIEKICAHYQIPLPAAALQFPLQHQAVSSTVTGFRYPSQVTDCITWKEHPIPDEFWRALHDEGIIKE